jgi:DNA polymerase-3 subunit beta
MKLIILKDNLREALARVERGVGESNNLPILKNVLCETKGSALKLSTTNLELGIQTEAAGKVSEEGAVTVPLHAFYTIVQSVDAERITLEADERSLLVKTDNYHARIQGMSHEEFPIIPALESEQTTIVVPGDVFAEAVASVAYAAQLSEIRPELGGVLIDFQVTVLKLVATDSFRLAEKNIITKHLKTTAKGGLKAIVPLRTMNEASRVFARDGELTLSLDKNQILMNDGKTRLISRLLGGTYPDYEQIIPKKNEFSFSVERERLMSGVRLVGTFSGKVNDIKMRTKDGAKVLEIFAASRELGENNYLVPIKTEGGELSEVSFNWRYLLDGLKAMSGKEVSIGISGDARPAAIKPADDSTYLYILMPIKGS